MNTSPLTAISQQVCERRYFQKNENGEFIEDWEGLTERVVGYVCKDDTVGFRESAKNIIYNTEFLPNSPCLVNAGTPAKSKGLLACFVSKSPEDSWVGMIENIANFGHIARQGGGCGVDFSLIRPEGDPVFGSTHAKACGPVEHMRMISEVMTSITQSGFRGMAMMSCLRIDHPDIKKFIVCKQHSRALKSLLKEDIFNHYEQFRDNLTDQTKILLDKFISNFNISAFVTDDFMDRVENNKDYDLVFNGKVYETVNARDLFDLIVESAWQNGDPGMLFYNTINDGPYKYSGQEITATNPCVTGDSIVLTSDGPKRIQDMVDDPHKVLSYDNGRYIWTSTNGAFRTKQNAEVLTIDTKNSTITCTPNHKILTDQGFIEGKDIVPGQMILSNPCGLGVSYGLDNSSREKWKGVGAEIQELAEISSNSRESTEEVVSIWVRSEENHADGFDEWMDILSIKEIFSGGEYASTREECRDGQNQEDEIRECEGGQKSLLQMAIKSEVNAENKKIQLRLVSLSNCGESLLAKFIRVDNGDVLRFQTNSLENGSSRLYSSEQRDLQTRLLYLFEEMETETDNRSEEFIHFSTSGLQSGDVSGGVQCANKTYNRYITICPKTFEFYTEMSVSMEEVVRVTKESKTVDVYDLTTNHESHNFIANGLVVHNCGEQCLAQYGSCNLGSIDVSKFYNDKRNVMEWTRLGDTIEVSIQFLDNVLEVNTFPTEDFEKWAKENRPVGLGIMGWADLLLKMKIAYGSEDSFKFAQRMGRFFQKTAHEKSVELGRKRGTPKACKYDELEHRRNVTTLSIAPTGTISLLAGCSGSIEPVFSATTYRYDNTGSKEMHHPHAKNSWFRCASDLSWQEHISMQSAFQPYVDSAISKTINFPNDATKEDVANAYMSAWKNGCKGITVYRDGCKSAQVLNTSARGVVGTNQAKPRPKEVPVDIFKTRADGFEWHILVGKVDDIPYEIFAVNGKQELPDKGIIVKRKRRHYSLMTKDRNILIDNIGDEEDEIHPDVALETRRCSLELRHNIHPKEIVEQIDKTNKVITSFSKASGRVLKKYVSTNDLKAMNIPCPDCARNGREVDMIPESGCWKCPKCHYSRCS